MDDFNKMVKVEFGNFIMGSDQGDEQPVHSVNLTKDFLIGMYSITQEVWKELMGDNPSYFKGDNLPVETVSWYDAVEYCNKRSQKEGYIYSGSNKNKNVAWCWDWHLDYTA